MIRSRDDGDDISGNDESFCASMMTMAVMTMAMAGTMNDDGGSYTQ